MKKRILFVLVALALLIGLATIPAHAGADSVVVTPLRPSFENQPGRTVPIMFSLTVDGSFLHDEGLTIKIFAQSQSAVILQTSTFGDGPTGYRIADDGSRYITHFQTSKVAMQYTVQVWAAGEPLLLGSFDFQTVGK